MPKPTDITTHNGKAVDWLTHAALLTMELDLGYRLTILQGHHVGTKASAGTHDMWGVVDLAPWDHANKISAGRKIGFWFWHRLPSQGPWVEHVHGNLVADVARMSHSAQEQVQQAKEGRNGLANRLRDSTPGPRPIPVFKWPGSKGALALEAKAHRLLDQKRKPIRTVTRLRVEGIDLSHHNTGITAAALAKAKKGGVDYTYLKATEGSSVKDATYAIRRAMVREAGMVAGAYHFARPNRDGRDGVTEAKFFLSVAKPAAGDMLPVLDLEDANHLSTAALDRWVGDFVGEVKRQLGVAPVIYTPFDLKSTHGCRLWVARYSNQNAAPRVPKPWTKLDMRQFSDGKLGVPNQIAGMHVDLNTLARGVTLEQLRIPVKKPPAPTPIVQPPKPPVVQPPKPPRAQPRILVVGTWNACRPGTRKTRKVTADPRHVAGEVSAILQADDLDVLALQETDAYLEALDKIPGYQLVARRKPNGTSNTCLLVRDGLKVSDVGFPEMTTAGWFTVTGALTPKKYAATAVINDWLRIGSEQYPPSVVFRLIRKVLSMTGPPRRTSAFGVHARREVAFFDTHPKQATAMLGDRNADNSLIGEFTPQWVADQVGGHVVATARPTHDSREIDLAILRGCHGTATRGDNGLSDHFRVRLVVTEQV